MIAPEIAPRTECACQPAAFIKSAILAPPGRCISARRVLILPVDKMWAGFELTLVFREDAAFRAFGDARLDARSIVPPTRLDLVISLSVCCDGMSAVTSPSPNAPNGAFAGHLVRRFSALSASHDLLDICRPIHALFGAEVECERAKPSKQRAPNFADFRAPVPKLKLTATLPRLGSGVRFASPAPGFSKT